MSLEWGKKYLPVYQRRELFYFHTLVMPRFLAIPWESRGEIRKSVFNACNLSATIVITAFTSPFFHPSQDLFLCHINIYLPCQVWGMARASPAYSSDFSTEQVQAPSAACVSRLFCTLLSSMNTTRTGNWSWAAKIKPWFPHRIYHWSQSNNTTCLCIIWAALMCFRP